jgi:ferritin
MTLNKTIQDALNEHMNQEFYASYLYLSMSAYCEEITSPASPTGCGRRARKSTLTP